MRNCIILGCGRSGTSLASGLLANGKYFFGGQLYEPSEGNPKGYFESPEINNINEQLLSEVIPRRPRGKIGDLFFRSRPKTSQRWLSVVPLQVKFKASNEVQRRIEKLTAKGPFCFKDPRFSYTMPAWRPFLGDAVFICVFRDPSATVKSILKECLSNQSMGGFKIAPERALAVWVSMYSHILSLHYPSGGEWLFIHYRQLVTGTAYDLLSRTLNTTLNLTFADHKLERSKANSEIPASAQGLYRDLCSLAGYEGK